MKAFVVFILAVMLTPALLAQQQVFSVDAGASEVRMTLKTTHEVVNGRFQIKAGSVAFDPHTTAMSGSVVVLAGSGKTGNGSRDKKMNKDILNIEHFATISFAPKSYTGRMAPSGDSNLQVTGLFTLLGADHEITIPMQIHVQGTAATAKAAFSLPYIQWGLKDPSFLFWKADKEVAIDLVLTGQLSR